MTLSRAVNAPLKQAPAFSAWVWFSGTTALYEGMGLCYDWDYDGAGDSCVTFDGRRLNRVELPSVSNARFFAGVAARDYAANATGQMIEIYMPGSCCNIYAKASCTIGVGILTCEAGGDYAGYWRYAGFQGEGSAVPLQTINRASTAGKVQALLQTGLPSGLVEVFDNTTGGAQTGIMVGGVTYLTCGTLGADATFTLADGTITGLRKKFVVLTDHGASYNFVLTISGKAANGVTMDTLSTSTFNNVTDATVLEWRGDWFLVSNVGASLG